MMNIFWKVYPTERQLCPDRKEGETCCFAPVVGFSHGFRWADTKMKFPHVPVLAPRPRLVRSDWVAAILPHF